jgi:hypothetical protein
MHRGTAQRRNSTQERRKQQHGTRSMHKSSTTTTHPSPCVLLVLNSPVQQRWKQPNIQNASSFTILPPFSPSSVAVDVDGGPFLCSLEPPRSIGISLTGRQPLPESRVGGISTAESHARSRVQGPKHPSPFVCATSPRVKRDYTYISTTAYSIPILMSPKKAKNQTCTPRF